MDSPSSENSDNNFRNLTFTQLVQTPRDHLPCLLKGDIIKLCQFHGISFESWEPKSKLIRCIKNKLDQKEIMIENLCDCPVYFSYKFKWRDDYICNLEDVLLPYEDYEITSSVKELETIVVSKERPSGIKIKYEDITDILYESNFPECETNIKIQLEDNESEWKKSALKLNFLMNELKRLGADKHDTYSCILDLHQDIDIPYHDEIDKENAGIPSILTNPT